MKISIDVLIDMTNGLQQPLEAAKRLLKGLLLFLSELY